MTSFGNDCRSWVIGKGFVKQTLYVCKRLASALQSRSHTSATSRSKPEVCDRIALQGRTHELAHVRGTFRFRSRNSENSDNRGYRGCLSTGESERRAVVQNLHFCRRSRINRRLVLKTGCTSATNPNQSTSDRIRITPTSWPAARHLHIMYDLASTHTRFSRASELHVCWLNRGYLQGCWSFYLRMACKIADTVQTQWRDDHANTIFGRSD